MAIEKVLVVDDEAIMCNFLVEALQRKGIDAQAAENGTKALKCLQESEFDLVITDMKMPGLSGMELLREVKKNSPSTLVIVMTAHGSIENAVEAMKAGAFHYLIKPFALEALMATIEKAGQHANLVAENQYLREEVKSDRYAHTLIAKSPAMLKVLADVERVAQSDASVFITGETGTGKEVVAHALHYHSPRQGNAFIRVNCAAIPDTLVESEFFGHEKGAFTGAANKRVGRFELAHQGTLLLDEVTEIIPSLQAKLLRVVQEQEFERVGGSKPVKVDVRLISTSNRNMKEAIADKTFREDLFYRLNVIPIHLPPLRERREDIIPLAEYFIGKKKSLSDKAKAKLLDYHWPGNVRELANIIERAIVMEPGKVIDPSSLYLERTDNPSGKTLPEMEKQLISDMVRLHQDNTVAAEKLGISVKMLRDKLKEHELA